MKKPIIIGNWKANKTLSEAKDWIATYKQTIGSVTKSTIILCPGFIHLQLLQEAKLGIDLGVQDVSRFSSGAYTGEISVGMLEGLARYALIGHSERRKNLQETDEVTFHKVKQARSAGLIPIVCVSELSQAENLLRGAPEFSETGIWLYEPLMAISTGPMGEPEDAGVAGKFARSLQQITSSVPVIYGGSVTPENVTNYLSLPEFSGVCAGGASLDPHKFASLILAAEKL